MDFKTYQELAATTCATSGFTHNLTHAALGMASEASEIVEATTPTDVIAEVGDALWFTSLALTTTGHTFEDLLFAQQFYDRGEPEHYANGLMFRAGNICDVVKKVFAYGKELNVERLLDEMSLYLWCMTNILVAYGFTLEQAMEANIAKLSARYPGLRYSAEACDNRNKGAEEEAVRNVTDR